MLLLSVFLVLFREVGCVTWPRPIGLCAPQQARLPCWLAHEAVQRRTVEGSLISLQVEFNFLDLEKAQAQFKVAMDDLNVESYEIGTGTATSDYYLVLEHVGGRITGRLEYNAELFSHATAQRMAADWQVGDSSASHQHNTTQHTSLHAFDIRKTCASCAK